MTDEQKSDLAVLAEHAQFLLDRLDDFSGDFDVDDFYGHVEPAASRLRRALSARLADAVQPAAGEGGLRLDRIEAQMLQHGGVDSDDLEWLARLARAALSTSVPAGVVENKKEALERVQSWVRNARTDLLTTDPEYWPKHNTLKSLGQFLREEVSALAPPAQEPTR